MATMMGFGRPTKTVIQTAFVVEDIMATIRYYTRTLNVGPFFLLSHAKSPTRTYRGVLAPCEVSVAMAFAGTMNIELVQQHDDVPSLMNEHVRSHGYGFHHYGVAHEDIADALPLYRAEGYQVVSTNDVPTGGTVHFLAEDMPAQPGYIELIPWNARLDETFTRYWQAAQDWNGSDPVRPFG
jgi:hypothetical protein